SGRRTGRIPAGPGRRSIDRPGTGGHLHQGAVDPARGPLKHLNNLGNLYHRTDRLRQAVEAYRRAVDIRERLARERPMLADNRISLVRSSANLAGAHAAAGSADLAAEGYARAEPLLASLTREFPDRTEVSYVGHLLEKHRAEFEEARGDLVAGCDH